MTPSKSQHAESTTRTCEPVAALMAWIFPGLGHLYLGQRRRGWLIMFGILFLFLSGLLVGGLDAVDLKNDRLWFIAQACNGPIAFIADFLNQSLVQSRPEEQKLHLIGLGHVNAIATLFIALGGLINLAVILDALYPVKRANHPKRRSNDA